MHKYPLLMSLSLNAKGDLECEARDVLIEVEQLRQQVHEWMVANGPGGWIDTFRKRAGFDPAFATGAVFPFVHWSKDSCIPYTGCPCISCENARAAVRTTPDP